MQHRQEWLREDAEDDDADAKEGDEKPAWGRHRDRRSAAWFLLTQQLALLRERALRIREDEKRLGRLMVASPALDYVHSIPERDPVAVGCPS